MPARRIRRFAREPRLDRLMRELARGFGPQRWWPAATPFEVIVGAVLVQNTAWRNVERSLAALRTEERLSPARLLALGREELAALVRPSGTHRAKARKLHAVSAWYLEAGGLAALRGRELGPLRAELLGVHGVGPETADAVLLYAAGRPAVVAGAYARRLLARHGLLGEGASYAEARDLLAERLVESPAVYQEFHALCVRTGYGNCTARRPDCESCPATPPPRG